MFIHCPHCGTYAQMRGPAAQIRCAFCDKVFEPSRLDVLRFKRMQEAEAREARMAPINKWGSVAIVAITALLFLGMTRVGAPGDPVGLATAWAFPFWVAALTGLTWWIHRNQQAELLPALTRTSVTLLLLLMLPLVYSGLPQEVRQAAHAPVQALTSMATNR